MVECSPALQKLQYQNLKCKEEDNIGRDDDKRTISMLAGLPVSWHATLEQVPSGCALLSSSMFSKQIDILNSYLGCYRTRRLFISA